MQSCPTRSMPWRTDNRSPSQVTRDSGGGVAEIGGETYFSQSVTSFDQNLLGLARPTATRRHGDLDITIWSDLYHHSWQCIAIPRTLRSHRDTRRRSRPAAVRRTHCDDAQT